MKSVRALVWTTAAILIGAAMAIALLSPFSSVDVRMGEPHGSRVAMGPLIEPHGSRVAMGPLIEPHGSRVAMGPLIEPHGSRVATG